MLGKRDRVHRGQLPVDLQDDVYIEPRTLPHRSHVLARVVNQPCKGHRFKADRQRVGLDRREPLFRSSQGVQPQPLGNGCAVLHASAHQQVKTNLLSHLATEQLPHRGLERLALDVPQRDVDRA